MSSRLNLLYCVKYKRKTDTVNILQITTTNNKNMNKGICSNCGKNKSSFISNILLGVEPSVLEVEPSIGKGFSLNSFVNNLPIELHQFAEKGEDVPGDLSITSRNIHIVDQVQNMNNEPEKDTKA